MKGLIIGGAGFLGSSFSQRPPQMAGMIGDGDFRAGAVAPAV